MKTLQAWVVSGALFLVVLVPQAALAQLLCSPIDRLQAPTSGGPEGDVVACCDGESGDDGCGPCRCLECGDETKERNIGRPVDTLSGFSWVERTDFNIAAPRGPAILFARTYSTHWAQSHGGRTEIGRLGAGWADTYAARLVFDGNTPAQLMKYRKADSGTELFTLQADGTYSARMPGRRLFFDSTTQRWVLEKFDASFEIFDTTGRLVHLRAQDGGEARLVYSGEDVSCPVITARPSGTLCRVDLLFGHQLWMRYATTTYTGAPRLANIAWDSAGIQVLVQFGYDAQGYLTTVTQADGGQETYAYDFTHDFPAYPGSSVRLLTTATDGDGKLVESFTYEQLTLAPSRVIAHETPEGQYTFAFGINAGIPERSTTIRSTQQNLRLTWENGKVKTVCQLDASGVCDVLRLKEIETPATGKLAPTCEKGFDGFSTRYVRDALGRRTSVMPGVVDCDNPTTSEAKHEVVTGYVTSSNRRAYTSRLSVDTTAPAGTVTFQVDDYTTPASAVNPLCGTSACQTPMAYNTPAGALTAQVQQRVQLGRTLANTSGDWTTRVEVTKFTYDSAGLLVTKDGPRTDVDDSTTYEYYSATGPTASAGRLKRVLHGTQVVAEYFDYNARGQAQRVVDGNGQETLYTYDVVGRVLTVQRPDDAQPTTYQYSFAGRVQQVKLPRGNRLLYTYDSAGRLISVGQTATASGAPTSFDEAVQYEWGTTSTNFGQLLRELHLQDGLVVRATSFTYDAQGRRAVVRYPRLGSSSNLGALRLTRFDEEGNILGTQVGTNDGVSDTLESATTHIYDNLQRLAEVQPSAQELKYDWHDNLTEVHETYGATGSNYPQTHYRYDDFGRLVEVSSTTLGTWRYVYDAAGNRVQQLQSNGDVLTSTFDGRRRVTSITGPGVFESYTYDTDAAATVLDCATGTALGASNGMGQLTAVTDASGVTYFGYTASGRPRFEARKAPGASCARVLRWEYEGNGQLSAMRYPSGATVRFEYPADGDAQMHHLSEVVLEVGSTTTPLATELKWEAGRLVSYIAGNSMGWQLSRWMDGSPREWTVTHFDDGNHYDVRRRTFGEGLPHEALDGRGSPLNVTEDDSTWTRNFTYQETTGYLTSSSRDGRTESYGYTGRWGDRLSREVVDESTSQSLASETYAYDTAFRLAGTTEVDASNQVSSERSYTYGPGGKVTEVTQTQAGRSKALALCYDAQEQVGAVVGAGGQYSRQVFNFRRQRVREVWPLNGLATDYWVNANGALLMEAGAASLTAQYPRPLGEYIYVDGQPIARVDSTEASNGSTTYQGISYLFGGHLGEVLVEADEWSHVVRSYDYMPFGAREARPAPVQSSGWTITRAMPFAGVSLPLPASARLRFTNYSLAACDSVLVFDSEDNLLTRLGPGLPSSFETEDLPVQGHSVILYLMQGACAGSSSLTFVEAKPSWGKAQQTVLSGYEYADPPTGFTTSLSLPANTHLLLEAHMADCDSALEVRSDTGTLLWSWPNDGMFLSTAWTPAFSGNVVVGFASSAGCANPSRSFNVLRTYTPLPPGPPANIHLPGQRNLTASASARVGALSDPEPLLFENWHRSYDPSIGRYLQPEPLAAEDALMATEPVYAYGNNIPTTHTDPTGLYTLYDTQECPRFDDAVNLVRKLAGCKGESEPRTCECKKALPCDICPMLEEGTFPPLRIANGLPYGRLGVTAIRDPSWWQRFVLNNAHPMTAMIAAQYPKVENVQIVRFWCNAKDESGVEQFAQRIIHEFSHACSQQLGYVVDDTMEAFGPAYNAADTCLGTTIWNRL
jgi:RHS repeat-associated protein